LGGFTDENWSRSQIGAALSHQLKQLFTFTILKPDAMKNHKKLTAIASVGLLAILMNGCIPSLQPLYTADKLVLLNGLAGEWKEAIGTQNGNSKKPEVWTFRQGEDKNYLLIHQDEDGLVAAFDVHVVKLGSHYFMDFYPGSIPEDMATVRKAPNFRDPESMNNFLKNNLIAVHTFAKVEMSGKTLKINLFDPEFLKNLLERQQIRIKHEKTENGYLLTASSADLQKFVEKYAEEKEAFLDDPIVLNLKN
jgi:hypothetical protein